MKPFRTFLVVFTAVLLALPQMAVRAQEEKVETFPVYAELDGFEHGVARLYEPDWAQILADLKEENGIGLMGDYLGVTVFEAAILVFDTEAQASEALETFGNLGIGAFAEVTDDEDDISFRSLR